MVFIEDSVSDDSGLKSIPKTKKHKRIGVRKTQKKKRRNFMQDLLASLKLPQEKENADCAAVVTPECIRKTMKYDEVDVLHINISYPKLKPAKQAATARENISYAKTEKKINKFYDSIVKSFVKYSEGILFRSAANEYLIKSKRAEHGTEYVEPFKAFGAVLNFEVTYNRGNLLCIYLDANVYTGKGRGGISRTAHIWDCSRGALVPAKRFADVSGENRKKICSRICAAIQTQIDRGEERYTNSDFKSVYRHFKAKNMFITDRGCNFFFPQSSLSPPECGIVSFIYS